jgi:cytoskeletal protein CcmA (bactofilin family)
MLFTTKMKEEPLVEIHSGIVLKGQLSMARDVLITGKFEGDLKTTGRLTVAPGGTVLGSVEAGALTLEPGYEIEGKIKVSSPAPAKTFDVVGQIKTSKWPLRLKKLKELAFGRK